MTRTIQISTRQYEVSHGTKPQQRDTASWWAFAIDEAPTPVCFRGTYDDALRHAHALAHRRVTVLP